MLGLALFSGLVYWLASCKIGYILESALGSGLFIGFLYGIYFGDVVTGLALGASIQLVYLGMVSTGGNMPADNALAAVIAIPVAMKSGLNGNAAVALAVPFGVLGVFLDQLRRTSNSIWIRKRRKCERNLPMCLCLSRNCIVLLAFCACILDYFIRNGCSCFFTSFLTTIYYQWILCCRWYFTSHGICHYYHDNWKAKINAILLYRILCRTVLRFE